MAERSVSDKNGTGGYTKKEMTSLLKQNGLEKVLKDKSLSIPALRSLARVFDRQKMLNKALICRKRIMCMSPDDPVAVADYLEFFMRVADREISDLARKLRRLVEEQSNPLCHLYDVMGDAMLRARARELTVPAHDAYRKAIALGSEAAGLKLSMALRSIGEYEESRQLFKEHMRRQLVKGEVSRMTVVQRLLDMKKDATYLEVGVRNGICFLQISAGRKFALDPRFIVPGGLAVDKGEEYYCLKSDEFFATKKEVLPPGGFDVVFVDGNHSYGQSLRDALNSLEHLKEDGVIVMHDCFQERGGSCVWKTIVHLRSLRRDLRVFVLDADCGLGIVTRGSPENFLNYTPEQVRRLTLPELRGNRDVLLNFKPASYFETFMAECESRSVRPEAS